MKTSKMMSANKLLDDVDILKLFEKKECLYVCAPMVRYSKLQFRTLVRQYNCDLCYTPMILADSFCRSQKARDNEFTTCLGDVPLITQFAANTVHDFVGAANMVAPYSNGVDLNCGCPQRWAKQMGVGCCLLEKPEVICDIVHQCRNQISKPFTVSVKMRLGKTNRETVKICRQLEKAGVSFIAIHGRIPSQQTGSINTEALKLVTECVSCPIIGNGDVKSLSDCIKLQEDTSCKGVMVANGLLTNPTLFSGSNCTSLECVQQWANICYNSTLDLNKFKKYCLESRHVALIPEKPDNLTFQCFHHHLVFMLEKLLPRNKRRVFNNLQTFSAVLTFLEEELNVVPQLFDISDYFKNCLCNLSYSNTDEVYHSLKEQYLKSAFLKEQERYDCDDHEGRYFKNRTAEVDGSDFELLNMFIDEG